MVPSFISVCVLAMCLKPPAPTSPRPKRTQKAKAHHVPFGNAPR